MKCHMHDMSYVWYVICMKCHMYEMSYVPDEMSYVPDEMWCGHMDDTSCRCSAMHLKCCLNEMSCLWNVIVNEMSQCQLNESSCTGNVWNIIWTNTI